MANHKRVGFFGGTFNPIHYGHLRIAEEVACIANLDQVMFVPSGIPPHRKCPDVSAQQRLDMVRLACADNPRFIVNPIETENSTDVPNYTIDTLIKLKELNPDTEFSLICGSDVQSQHWYRFKSIMEIIDALYIVHRPGDNVESMNNNIKKYVGEGKLYDKYHWIQTDGWPISSTLIRELISKGHSLRYLIPDKVIEYIVDKKLYSR